jgi:hypothetical protein
MKLIALITRTDQVGPDTWESKTIALEIADGETVESVFKRAEELHANYPITLSVSMLVEAK